MSADDELLAAEHRIFAAIAAKDAGRLSAELAEDFVHTPLGGPDQERDAFLRAIQDMPFDILDLRGEGLRVRVMDGVAVLSGIQLARVRQPDGSVAVGRSAFVDTFAAGERGWRLRHAVSVDLTEGPAGAAE
jgi:hypothetical protein